MKRALHNALSDRLQGVFAAARIADFVRVAAAEKGNALVDLGEVAAIREAQATGAEGGLGAAPADLRAVSSLGSPESVDEGKKMPSRRWKPRLLMRLILTLILGLVAFVL